jgi:hypothetical protein
MNGTPCERAIVKSVNLLGIRDPNTLADSPHECEIIHLT